MRARTPVETFAPILLIFICAVSLGLRFKQEQLNYIAPGLFAVYPLAFKLVPIGFLFLVILSSWLAWGLLVAALLPRTNQPLSCCLDASTNLIWLSVGTGRTLSHVFILWLSLKLIHFLAIVVMRGREGIPRLSPEIRRHLSAFALIVVVQALLNGPVAPPAWRHPTTSVQNGESELLGLTSRLHRAAYVNAKALDFSGFDLAYWGALGESPTGYYSRAIGALSLLLDKPAIDFDSYHRLLQQLFFLWCVGACFGFYLFLLQGLELGFLTSAIGALLYQFGNPFFAYLFQIHFPGFVGPYLALPWALWLARRAFRKESAWGPFTAGLLYSLSFYLMPAHPDAYLQGTAFLFSYLLYLVVFSRDGRFVTRARTLILCGIGATLGSTAYLAPIAREILSGEARFFGHHEGTLYYPAKLGVLFILLPCLFSGGVLPLATCLRARELWRDENRRVDLIFFSALTLLLGLFFIPGASGPGAKWLAAHAPSIYFLNPFRPLIYFSLSATVVAMFGLHSLLEEERNRPFPELVPAIAAWLMLTLLFTVGSAHPSLIDSIVLSFHGLTSGTVALFVVSLTACLFAFYFLSGQYRCDLPANHVRVPVYLLAVSGILVCQGLGAWRNPVQALARSGCEPHLSVAVWQTLERGLGFPDPASEDFIKGLDASAPRVPFLPTTYSCPKSDKVKDVAFDLLELFRSVPGRFHRTLAATGDLAFFGLDGPFVMSNSLMSIDPRFMTVYPSLQRLYLMPGQAFRNVGRYNLPVPWAQSIEVLADPTRRKLMEIAGVDLFAVSRSDFAGLKDHSELIQYPAPTTSSYLVVGDERANGMGYLASQIQYVDDITARQPSGALENTLFALRDPRSAIIEDTERRREHPKALMAPSENRIAILGILGNHAAFDVFCRAEPCELVYNLADLDGWKAFAEGEPLPLHRANFAFLGVRVPKGRHLVWFEYRAPAAVWGIFLTAIGYTLALVWALLITREGRIMSEASEHSEGCAIPEGSPA